MKKRLLLSNMLVNKQLEVGKYNIISALGHSFLLSSLLLHLQLVQTRPSWSLAGEPPMHEARSPTVPKLGVSKPGTALCQCLHEPGWGIHRAGVWPFARGWMGWEMWAQRPRLRSPAALARAEAGGTNSLLNSNKVGGIPCLFCLKSKGFLLCWMSK